MKKFLDDNFLLSTGCAEQLYHEYAVNQPIYDYHCHLPPEEIAQNRQFENLSQIWLAGDHYKWRALRTAGVDEALITGSGSDYEKFMAWAATVPLCMGSPLYHWTHLELRRPFGLSGFQLDQNSATNVWARCNDLLAEPNFSTQGILRQMNVKMVGTTDDPLDSLEHHDTIAADAAFNTAVLPTWRPDKLFKIGTAEFERYRERFEQVVDRSISSWSQLCEALLQRLDHFDLRGCVSADHGMEVVRFAEIPGESVLDQILDRSRAGKSLSEEEIAQYCTALHIWMGQEYARRNWVMQLHIGALRNNNSRLMANVGADSGCDSIGDRCFAEPLSRILDGMDRTGQLPKTILYCLNSRDNDVLATMAGNFQSGGIPGKIQFGSGWWFNDQKSGMIAQLTSLANMGLLSQFVGMLTDSRSFLSFTRHEYFRRILCDLLGRWVENGELPADYPLLGKMVTDICSANAVRYFGFESAAPIDRSGAQC